MTCSCLFQSAWCNLQWRIGVITEKIFRFQRYLNSDSDYEFLRLCRTQTPLKLPQFC